MLSVIIPACNEAAYIGPCLEALLASDPPAPTGGGRGDGWEVIVVANGCRDDTAARARAGAAAFARADCTLRVLEIAPASKPAALNAGDGAARGALRAYLDADVLVSPPLIAQLAARLGASAAPLYASGTLHLTPSSSPATRRFARAWSQLPYMTGGVTGAGLYAVNAAGRARWDSFPDIICDDGFVRRQFAPAERVAVPAGYQWPLADGAAALVRVRRRQEVGNRQLETFYPHLDDNQGRTRPRPLELWRAARASPLGFALYAGVTLIAKLTADPTDLRWRGSR